MADWGFAVPTTATITVDPSLTTEFRQRMYRGAEVALSDPSRTTDVLAAWGRPVRTAMMQETPPRASVEICNMTSRTTQTVVHFSSAFRLPGFDAPQPAGDHRVDHDEELIEGASRLAWLRVGAFMHLPAIATHASTQQMVPINPADLEAALATDIEQS